MQRAAFVLALLLIPTDRTLVMVKRRDGRWYLPGGPAGTDGTEQGNLEALVPAQTGLQVQAIEQVGPLHQGATGSARVFDCQVDGQAALTDGDVVDMEYLTLDAFRLLDVGDSAHRRAALDGFTIMSPPDVIGAIDDKYQEFAPIEGVFVGGDPNTLIQVGSDEQRTWRRLDM